MQEKKRKKSKQVIDCWCWSGRLQNRVRSEEKKRLKNRRPHSLEEESIAFVKGRNDTLALKRKTRLVRCLSPGEMKRREVELGPHRQLEYLLLQFSKVALWTLSVWLYSAQLLKQQLAKCTSCVARAGPLPPYHCCSGDSWHSLRSLRFGARGRAVHLYLW